MSETYGTDSRQAGVDNGGLRHLLPLFLLSLVLTGCAALMNSGRPRYSGPIVKPAWHYASLVIENAPVITAWLAITVAAVARITNGTRRKSGTML